MRRYPIRVSDIASYEDIEVGQTYVKMSHEDYVRAVNSAFYFGFELGCSETVEEAKSITLGKRVELCLIATRMMNEYFAGSSDEGGAQCE